MSNANVIPMRGRGEQHSLEDLTRSYKTVLDTAKVKDYAELYEKFTEKGQLKEALAIAKDKELNKLLCPEQEDGEYLMSIPDSLARFDVLNSYPEEFKEETEAALNKIKDNLYKKYSDLHNDVIKSIEDSINSNEKFKNLTPEQKTKMVIVPNIHAMVGRYLLDTRLTPKGDSNAAKIYAELKEIQENPEKYVESAKESIIQSRRLPHYTQKYLNIDKDELIAIKVRELGKELVKEQNGKFVFDDKKFKEIFDNYDSGLNMATFIETAAKAYHEQANALEQAKVARAS